MQATAKYNESYKVYSTKSGNTKILVYRKRRARNKVIRYLLTDNCYFLKQKALGIVMAAISVLVPIVCGGDATASLFILPLALYALFWKEKLFVF